jgi:hypothetical protein
MTDMTSTNRLREAFEAWATSADYWLEGTTIPRRSYSSENTEHAWRAWQAATLVERDRMTDIVLIELDCNGQAGAILRAIWAG